jgi:hypothetical protein
VTAETEWNAAAAQSVAMAESQAQAHVTHAEAWVSVLVAGDRRFRVGGGVAVEGVVIVR